MTVEGAVEGVQGLVAAVESPRPDVPAMLDRVLPTWLLHPRRIGS